MPPDPPKFNVVMCAESRFAQKVGVYFAARKSPQVPVNIALRGAGVVGSPTAPLLRWAFFFADTGYKLDTVLLPQTETALLPRTERRCCLIEAVLYSSSGVCDSEKDKY